MTAGKPWQVVLAENAHGVLVALGPVQNDESVTRLRDEAEERGWTDRGTAYSMSAAQFRRYREPAS